MMLIVQKQNFYEKELSESADERYLLVYFIKTNIFFYIFLRMSILMIKKIQILFMWITIICSCISITIAITTFIINNK
jgi:hypothetical protein